MNVVRLRAVALAYLAALAAIAVFIDRLADVWWPGTALAFAPRWIWGVPLLALLPAAYLRDRRLVVPLLIGLLVYLGPIMDLRLPVRRLFGSRARDLRVMTYNVGGGDIDPRALNALVRHEDPDVIALQERADAVDAWHDGLLYAGRCSFEQCVFSHSREVTIEERDRADLLAQHGGSGSIVRYGVTTRRGPLDVIGVHLATVREGLLAVMHRPLRGGPELAENIRLRAHESEAARTWANRVKGPFLVMGDFNMPVESAIYRRWWGDLPNAFSTGGLGFGTSKATRWHGIRIDHVLAGPGWEVIRSWVEPGLGGDHRPVFADLRWIGP